MEKKQRNLYVFLGIIGLLTLLNMIPSRSKIIDGKKNREAMEIYQKWSKDNGLFDEKDKITVASVGYAVRPDSLLKGENSSLDSTKRVMQFIVRGKRNGERFLTKYVLVVSDDKTISLVGE